MASPKPLKEGQIPISCQLCEDSNEIKWKCLQCDFLLCTKCQKLHKKVKSNDQHTIIDIKDIAEHLQQTKDNKDFRNISCKIHSGQNCCLFCQTCDEVVCPSCIANTHAKHNMVELVEGYTLTAKKIKTFNSELHIQLSNYKRGRSNLFSFKSSEDSKYESMKQTILSREKVLKHEVEMHTTKLLKELEKSLNLQTKSVSHANIKLKKITKDLEYRTESLTNALASVNTFDVFSAYKEEKTARKLRTEQIDSGFKRLPHYVPGKILIPETLHGELIASGEEYPHVGNQYEAKVITQYKTGLKIVGFLNCCDDGTLWIGSAIDTDNIIQKIQLSNKLVAVVQEIQKYFVAIALLPTGDILISTAKPYLKILSHTTGKISHSKYNVAPLITGAVHVTGDCKIIVRTREKGNVFPIKGTRQVVVMNIEGRTEKVYELDNNEKPLFFAPQRITTDTDNNIYVLDRLHGDKNGRIVAVQKTNGVRWIYVGNPDINKGQATFKPFDLVCTKLNNIIIADMRSDMIHILNSSGQCIHYLNTKDQLGIYSPFTLEIDHRGTLYIGCGTYQSEHKESKIYAVQFSGF